MSDIEELTPGFVERWCERPVGGGGRRGPRAPSGSTVRFNRWAAREILEAAVEAGAQIEPDALVPLRNARRPAANAASLEESAASRQPRNLTDDDWAALACGQRRGMGIAHEASDAASTEAAVNAWSPRWSRKDLREGQVVLGAVRPWVLAANPPSVKVARSWLRIVADHTAFFCSKDGTLDPEHIFHPENINHWVMKVIGGRFPSTRRTVRSVLRRVGRAVAPAVSPRQMPSLGTVEAAVIYNAVEEESFRLAAELEWPSNRAALMWLSVATLGAGLRGVEAQMQGPGDVVAVGGGRLTVHVAGRNPRWVPIRSDYTGLALGAVRLTSGDRFIPSEAHGSASGLAKQLHVGGVGSLSLSRARATWIAAQLRSDVSLRALRRFSGPINHQTFDALVRQAAEEMDDETAVLKGLAA